MYAIFHADLPIHRVDHQSLVMPARAILFDNKVKVVGDLGIAPRNEVHFNAHGTRTHMEI